MRNTTIVARGFHGVVGVRIWLFALLSSILFCLPCSVLQAQDTEVQQLLLNVEKLEQLREMLDNMKDKYRILQQGYQQVRSISEGNFTLHEQFLARLYTVSPQVKSYHRVVETIQLQAGLIQGLNEAKRSFGQGDFLVVEELEQVEQLYGLWLKSSLRLLEEMLLILSDGQLQLDDWERIQALDRVHASMKGLVTEVSRFSVSITHLGELRMGNRVDQNSLKSILSYE